jgi:hypothetical protein
MVPLFSDEINRPGVGTDRSGPIGVPAYQKEQLCRCITNLAA